MLTGVLIKIPHPDLSHVHLVGPSAGWTGTKVLIAAGVLAALFLGAKAFKRG